MDYKSEIMVNKSIIHSNIHNNYSHPNQIVKLAAKSIDSKYPYFVVFVMNKYGEIWVYGLEKKKSGYRALPLKHEIRDKAEVLLVFSDNMSISELV